MSLKLMAVDDEPAVLKLIKSIIEPLGCEILILADSQEAAQRIDNEKFDGFLLDVQMPSLDGFELTKRIRVSSPNRNVPVVMLTGFDDVETMRKGFKAGVTCFLGKPLTQERLYNLVKAIRGPMLTEKRRNVRLPYHATVRCKKGPFFDEQFTSDSQTISQGGMSLRPSGGLGEGDTLEVEFKMAGAAKLLRVRGKIVRKDQTDQIGVAFIDLRTEARQAIQLYIEGAVTL